ncbi:MAG TPA: hypothetical protein VFC09_14450 [Candidatus Dormibacteraeota bacterium]|nr:hypothetical protein [Candidatus Dormibacteraeota bacterium]
MIAPETAAPVRVVEVTAERDVEGPPEIPWELAPEPGRVAMQLRSTVRRVLIGAGLARRLELVEAVRNLPGLPGLATSPAGGTFVVGGPGWLGLCAIGTLPDRRHPPLDWMMDALRTWFATALRPLGVEVQAGRVDGAWCPGFSDISTGGRKLAGLGFRVTRGMVVMRGVLPVTPIDAADLALLRATHRMIGLQIDGATLTSLAEATGDPTWTVERALAHLRTVETGAGS